jgi:hypothetical protein
MNTWILAARRTLIAGALAIGTGGSLVIGLITASTPAKAQFTVFDPGNYSQNILTAARTLQQINNQIQMLQNQAQSLTNQAKNLSTITFPELQAINQTIQQIDQLMGQAQGIRFRVAAQCPEKPRQRDVECDQRAAEKADVAAEQPEASVDVGDEGLHELVDDVEVVHGRWLLTRSRCRGARLRKRRRAPRRRRRKGRDPPTPTGRA